jgi:hypothetical protein
MCGAFVVASGVVLLNAQLAGAAQTSSASPTFEVATIKLNQSGERRPRQVVLPRAGRLTLTNISIRELIQDAYGLPFSRAVIECP